MFAVGLASCNSFDEDRVINDQATFLEISEMAKSNGLTYSNDSEYDILSDNLRWNGIDEFLIKYKSKYEYAELEKKGANKH